MSTSHRMVGTLMERAARCGHRALQNRRDLL